MNMPNMPTRNSDPEGSFGWLSRYWPFVTTLAAVLMGWQSLQSDTAYIKEKVRLIEATMFPRSEASLELRARDQALADIHRRLDAVEIKRRSQ
jgi:hypothetical protein